MLKTAVFVSGGGTNLQALLDQGVPVSLVVARREVKALDRARARGVEALVIDGDFEAQALAALRKRDITLIVLAGFLTILSQEFIEAFPGRIVNVHPSLIPAFCGKGFYGLRVHEEALKRGVKVTGATVHYVNAIPDGGEILAQKAVDVLPGDTPETLQKRVMEQAEWVLLPRVVKQLMDVNTTKEETDMQTLSQAAGASAYPGRGIILGKSADGQKSVISYFIMGRSENSRNRVFTEDGLGIRTEACDPDKLRDPSLIIYSPVRVLRAGTPVFSGFTPGVLPEDITVVTNGDQTDTICEYILRGDTFESALRARTFEPDAPNYTPRISGVVRADGGYALAILKSADGNPDECLRFFYEYDAPVAGVGHFLHTYHGDGNPLPSFRGEPTAVKIGNDPDEIARELWDSLDENNKVALFVRVTCLQTGAFETRVINKYQRV